MQNATAVLTLQQIIFWRRTWLTWNSLFKPNNTAENFEYKTELYKCLKRVIYKAFYFFIPDIEKIIEVLLTEIDEIMHTNPYMYKYILDDNEAINETKKDLKEGDNLVLQRKDNKYDSNAILVLTEDKRKIGYVPSKDNIVFARLMDAGKMLKAKI